MENSEEMDSDLTEQHHQLVSSSRRELYDRIRRHEWLFRAVVRDVFANGRASNLEWSPPAIDPNATIDSLIETFSPELPELPEGKFLYDQPVYQVSEFLVGPCESHMGEVPQGCIDIWLRQTDGVRAFYELCLRYSVNGESISFQGLEAQGLS